MAQRKCVQCGMPQMLVQFKRSELPINSDNQCAYCEDFNKRKDFYSFDYNSKRQRFEKLASERRGNGAYDAVVMFTGGKDSCYTIYLLTQVYKFKVLALTWDNGFFGKEHRSNLENITKAIGVDHQIVSLENDVLTDFYRNRFRNFGRFCGCGSISFLFTSPAIEKSGADLIVTSGSMGQTVSRLQNNAVFKNSGENKDKYLEKAIYELGFTSVRNEQINLMMLIDILIGDFSEKSIKYFSECLHALNTLHKRDAYIINMPCIFEWDLKVVYEKIKTIGWKKPAGTAEMGHTSCTMEPMKGYIAYKQNILNLDVNELCTERRLGNITEKQFDEAFGDLGYSDKIPDEYESWLNALNITPMEFESILKKSPLSNKEPPKVNPELVKMLPIEIPKENLEKKIVQFYQNSILG